MNTGQTETPTETTLVLEGSARIGEIDDLKQVFLAALASSQPLVTLDLSAVDATDVTFFQLLLSFQKSLTDQGRHLILSTLPRDHTVMQTAALLGIPLSHHFTQVEAPQ